MQVDIADIGSPTGEGTRDESGAANRCGVPAGSGSHVPLQV